MYCVTNCATNSATSDLFVVQPKVHTFFRFVAAFIIAPLLIWKGIQYQDWLLLVIGIITLLVDLVTFSMSIKAQK